MSDHIRRHLRVPEWVAHRAREQTLRAAPKPRPRRPYPDAETFEEALDDGDAPETAGRPWADALDLDGNQAARPKAS